MQEAMKIYPDELKVEDLTAERMTEFLNWLECECGHSITTTIINKSMSGWQPSIRCFGTSSCRLRNMRFSAGRCSLSALKRP
jgi:hypothetical protein